MMSAKLKRTAQERTPGERGDRRGISRVAKTAVVGVIAGAALAACSSSSNSSPAAGAHTLTAVTIARTDPNTVQSNVFNVAQQEGFFTKEGLKVSIPVLTGDAAAIPAVESGAINFSEDTAPPVLVADHNGANLSIISDLSFPPGEIVVSKQAAATAHITNSTPMATKVRDLKGMTFAVEDVGGGLEYQIDALLLRYGVPINDVHVIGISSFTAELTAMSNGTIDGVSIVPPFGNVATLTQGAINIGNVWGGQVPGLSSTPFETIEGKTSFIKSHPALTAKVQKAFALALAFMHQHPTQVTKINEAILGTSFSTASVRAAVGTGAGWPTSPTISKAQYADIISFMKVSGLQADTNISYDQAIAPIAR